MSVIFVDSESGRLAVEVEGTGPLVVCSPGIGDTRDAFAPLAKHLTAHGFKVACVDLRGHGDSTTGFKRYGDEATAQDLLTVIDAVGGGPAVLAGASLSGASAVIAAAERPEQVAGLVLLGAFLRNSVSETTRRLLQIALARPWGPPLWRAQAAKLWPGLGDRALIRAEQTTALLTRQGRWAAFQATVSGADHRVVAPRIKNVRAPVLVVMGDADPDWKDPMQEAEWIASNFSDSEILRVPGAGHAPMLERPEIVASAVLRFLERIHHTNTADSYRT